MSGVRVEAPAGAAVGRSGTWWRSRQALLVAYLLGLHIALAGLVLVLVAKTDFLPRVYKNLDVAPEEFDQTYRRWAAAFARSDARARPGALLFVGDSIMRDLDASSMARHTLNLAIPGDTTARALQRMKGYRALLTARGVVLGVGINDLMRRRSVPEALANYRALLGLVPREVPILAVAVLPLGESARAEVDNAEIARLNEGIATLCAERPGCHFVDPSRRLTNSDGALVASAHDGDGVHLSATAHEIYWSTLNQAVSSFVPTPPITPPAR